MTALIYSGKDAYVGLTSGVNCVQSWQATPSVTAQEYAASCAPGGTIVPAGIIDWKGQINGFGDYPVGVIPSGVDTSFQGVINNTAMSLKSLTGTILIEQLTIEIDKSTYAPIKWTATFGAQGNLTVAASGSADSGTPSDCSSAGLTISIAGTPLTQSLTKAQIVLSKPHTTYVDVGFTKRKAGNMKCTLNFGVQEASLAVAAYAPNSMGIVRITTNVAGDRYWEFDAVRFLGKSNFTVDRQSTNILGYQVNGQWSFIDDSQALGYIMFSNPDDDPVYIIGEAP